jgi:hypothetical protein
VGPGCRQELFHTLGDPSLPALFDLSRSFVDLRLGTGSNSAPIWFDEFCMVFPSCSSNLFVHFDLFDEKQRRFKDQI